MTESIIQSEPFPGDCCMLDTIVLWIDSNTWWVSFSLIIVPALEL